MIEKDANNPQTITDLLSVSYPYHLQANEHALHNGIRPLPGFDFEIPHLIPSHNPKDESLSQSERKDDLSVDVMESIWSYHLSQNTPNGSIYSKNSFYSSLKSGKPITLVHVTPVLDRIIRTGYLKPSGGCLGASLYTVPLSDDGREHNLTKHLRSTQLSRNLYNPRNTDTLLLEFGSVEQDRKLTGIDYLSYGVHRWEVFKQAQAVVTLPDVLKESLVTDFKRKVTPDVIRLLKLCDSPASLRDVSVKKFQDLLLSSLKSFGYLGQPLFEAFIEYVALHQDDEESQELLALGELNNLNYYELAFSLRPKLYDKFSLGTFNPSFDELSDGLYTMANKGKGILKFDQDHFNDYMKWRVAHLIRRALCNNGTQVLEENTVATFEDLEVLGTLMPSLVGQVIYRGIKTSTEQDGIRDAYEEISSRKIWEYWDMKGVTFLTNYLLPKGEVGFNPSFFGNCKVFQGKHLSDGRIVKVSNTPLQLRMNRRIISKAEAAMRPY